MGQRSSLRRPGQKISAARTCGFAHHQVRKTGAYTAPTYCRLSAFTNGGCAFRSAAAKLGWIVVAGGLVLQDRRKARIDISDGTLDDLPRFGMMHLCGVGSGSTEDDQKNGGQNRTHRTFSNRSLPSRCDARLAARQSVTASRSLKSG